MPYHQLRDARQTAPQRLARRRQHDRLCDTVRQVVLAQPTTGYRLLYQERKARGERIGLHKVRIALRDLEPNPAPTTQDPEGWRECPHGNRVV
ncbi:hypothetical protein [Deinococcus pimensis]|uniref:hypothetical protein n=1 Tax=Deinococcus pimensis TaxID=309888 RepID=UPI0012F9DE61|nr:hypothetical protein [Deinococcus pimensis]